MAQEFEGLYVKFGANTVEFDNSVKGMNSALSTLKKDLQTLNKNLKFDPGNVVFIADFNLLLKVLHFFGQ